MSSASRKEELEIKKAKLAKIREEKKRREDEKRFQENVIIMHSNDVEPDELLKELGITAPKYYQIENGLLDKGEEHLSEKDNIDKRVEDRSVILNRLTLSNISQTNILPVEKVVYNKEVQIDIEAEKDEESTKPVQDYYVLTYANHEEPDFDECLPGLNAFDFLASDPTHSHNHMLHNGASGRIIPRSSESPAILPKHSPADHDTNQLIYTFPLQHFEEMDSVEKTRVLNDANFLAFVEHGIKIVKRILCEPYDITVDYARDTSLNSSRYKDSDDYLTLKHTIMDETLCANRSITSMDWSTQFPELLVASYYKGLPSSLPLLMRNGTSMAKSTLNNQNNQNLLNNQNLTNENSFISTAGAGPLKSGDLDTSAGLVCVWNTRFGNLEPEYILTYQSIISHVIFATKWHPNLIIGGCYSGQLVVWDNRSNKSTPVQRTPLTHKAHTHPICGLQMIGSSQSSNSLLSLSTDGKLLEWSLDGSFATPLTVLDLLGPSPSLVLPVSAQSTSALNQSNASASMARARDTDPHHVLTGASLGISSVTCLSFPSPNINQSSSSTMNNINDLNNPFVSNTMNKNSNYSLQKSSKDLNASSSLINDNYLVVGTEQGPCFSARRLGTKSGINEVFEGHSGPVLDICFNPSPLTEYNHFFITCSTDWSVKLWSLKNKQDVAPYLMRFPVFSTLIEEQQTNLTANLTSEKNNVVDENAFISNYNGGDIINSKFTTTNAHLETTLNKSYQVHTNKESSNVMRNAIWSIDSFEEYVYCVQWSPTNPALFALGTGSGTLQLYSLMHSLEEPLFSESISKHALNSVKWSSTGTHLAVGDDFGHIWLFEVSQRINQTPDEQQFTSPLLL